MDAERDADRRDGDQQQVEEESRHMNDTTLPRKKTSVLPAVALGGVLPRQKVPPPNHVGGTPRKRFGLADWHRLVQSSPNLAGNNKNGGIIRKMGWPEIRQHKTVHDGWIVLRGKVYNIAPYLAYHPGGSAILERVLGKDVTALFDKYHRWVNETGLIGKLLIGYLDTGNDQESDEDNDSGVSYLPSTISTNDGFAMPAPREKR